MNKTLLIAATLALAACADGQLLPTDDCKITDWYRIGYRDGSVAGRSSFESYVAHCKGAFAVKPDEAAYNKGLEVGQWEKAHRRF